MPIQDEILAAATAFQAKGPEEYIDRSTHHSVTDGSPGEDVADPEEQEEEVELAQPILLRDPR